MAEQIPSPSPDVVGHAFVQQYYMILHTSPELVHRFYQEHSRFGRPDGHGNIISVTTTGVIHENILSMGYPGVTAEIKTVDSQASLGDGVFVLVTGCLTFSNGVKRDFTQSFFLAPQNNGFFVLNDLFRFTDQGDHLHVDHGLANGFTAAIPPEEQEAHLLPEQQHVVEQQVLPQEEEIVSGEEVHNPQENGEVLIAEKEAPVVEVIKEVQSIPQVAVAEPSPPVTLPVAEPSAITKVPAEKMSYASIVKIPRDNTIPFKAPPKAPLRSPPTKAPAPRPAPAEVPPVVPPVSSKSSESDVEVDSHSIYIKGLPLNATADQIQEEFKRFGPIKPEGIQVRSNKVNGFCFGFVEFEVASAVQSAIEASPVMIGGRQAYVEEKRTSGARGNIRGRFAPGRGYPFRNDGPRGRGSYTGRGGYGRGDFNNRADFGSRGVSSGRGGEGGYQRVDYSGNGGGRGNPINNGPRAPLSA